MSAEPFSVQHLVHDITFLSWAYMYSHPLLPYSSLLLRVNEPFSQNMGVTSNHHLLKQKYCTKYFDILLLQFTDNFHFHILWNVIVDSL